MIENDKQISYILVIVLQMQLLVLLCVSRPAASGLDT